VPPARTPPELPSGGEPVSVLVDYDGTISQVDIGDQLLARFFPDVELTAAKDAEYDTGLVGSRELMRWDMDVLPRDAGLLGATAAQLPQDGSFPAFVHAVRGHGAAIEVVSDGLGFYVASNLERMGLADLPIATNENRVQDGGAGMSFPYGHPRCFVCGTCKRERVRMHRAHGRAVVFVGDGTSDRFAAAHADVVFAKQQLATICRTEGWPYHAWETFDDIRAWIDDAFERGRLPATAADLDAWRANHAPGPRPFICGPEVWGEGRTTPGPGPGVIVPGTMGRES
jgi:2-hydroxy-3-keto-5-methylthiopentenyl-1-phosphate phosphatase